MKKRLRKKHRLGEFAELGFDVEIVFKPGVAGTAGTAGPGDEVLADLVGCVQRRGLFLGGGITGRGVQFTVARWRGAVTEAERQAVIDDLRGHPAVESLEAAPLVDLWH